MRSVIMMIVATLALASALRVQVSSTPLSLSARAMRCRSQPLMAADEPAEKAATAKPVVEASTETPVEAPPPTIDFTPDAPAKTKPDLKQTLLDPTNYSISLSLLFVFIVVKSLSYFGVLDLAD